MTGRVNTFAKIAALGNFEFSLILTSAAIVNNSV